MDLCYYPEAFADPLFVYMTGHSLGWLFSSRLILWFMDDGFVHRLMVE